MPLQYRYSVKKNMTPTLYPQNIIYLDTTFNFTPFIPSGGFDSKIYSLPTKDSSILPSKITREQQTKFLGNFKDFIKCTY